MSKERIVTVQNLLYGPTGLRLGNTVEKPLSLAVEMIKEKRARVPGHRIGEVPTGWQEESEKAVAGIENITKDLEEIRQEGDPEDE